MTVMTSAEAVGARSRSAAATTTQASRPYLRTEDLRLQLPAAVLARPAEDTVALRAWVLLAETLEATAHVLACAQDGTSFSVVDVLRSHAVRTTLATLDVLGEDRTAARFRPSCVPGLETDLTVERSWLRLAGVLTGPCPADVALLASCLSLHAEVLREWHPALPAAR